MGVRCCGALIAFSKRSVQKTTRGRRKRSEHVEELRREEWKGLAWPGWILLPPVFITFAFHPIYQLINYPGSSFSFQSKRVKEQNVRDYYFFLRFFRYIIAIFTISVPVCAKSNIPSDSNHGLRSEISYRLNRKIYVECRVCREKLERKK